MSEAKPAGLGLRASSG